MSQEQDWDEARKTGQHDYWENMIDDPDDEWRFEGGWWSPLELLCAAAITLTVATFMSFAAHHQHADSVWFRMRSGSVIHQWERGSYRI